MFKPDIQLRNFEGGLNTGVRPSKIKDNQMASLISMDFDANTLRRAQGFTLFGTESDSTLTGKSLYTHQILAGTEVMIKAIGTKLKYYDDVDDTWYLLTDSTFTADLRWSFATFNGYLYGCNGTDNWIFWNGGARSTLNGAILAGATTIDLQTGHGARFAASGTILIGDDVITYSGITTDQLTGVSGALAHASGSTVIQKLDSTTYSGLTKSSKIAFFRNRLYAVDETTPTFIRHSKLADNSNPETDIINFTVLGSGAGDAGFGIAPAEIISIIPIIGSSSTTLLACFCKDGNVYSFVVTDGASTTTNAFILIRTMGTYPAAKQLVCYAEDDIAFIDYLGHFRTLKYGDVNTPVQSRNISDDIDNSLETMDFSDGHIVFHQRKLYGTGMTENANSNDLTFYHDAYYNAWGSYGHWDVVCFAIYNTELYGLSTITGNVWKLNDGYSANDETYYSENVMKELDWGFPLIYKTALKIRLRGFISSNCDSHFDLFTERSGTAKFKFLLNGDNTNITGLAPNVAIGSVVFGKGVFGGGLPSGSNRREFYAELQLNDLEPFLNLTIKQWIDALEVDFELEDLTIWSKLEGQDMWIREKTLSVT